MFTSTLCTLCRDQWSNPLFSLSAHADLYKKGDGNSGEFSAGERKQACTRSFRMLSYKSSSGVGAADPDHPLFPSFLCPFCLPPPMLRFQHTSFLTSSYRKSFRPSQHFSAPVLPTSLMPFLLFYLSQFPPNSHLHSSSVLFILLQCSSCPFQPALKCPRLEWSTSKWITGSHTSWFLMLW